MKPMDYHAFSKWVQRKGYRIDHSTKHQVLLDKTGTIVAQFAVAHKQGGKRYIKATYVREILRLIGP